MSFDFTKRINDLQTFLRSRDIDLALLNQNSDIYYYTGSVQPLYLLVPSEGQPLMLARKALEQARVQAPHITLEPFYGGRDLAALLDRYGFTKSRSVGYTLDVTSYLTVTRFQKMLGDPQLADISWDIRMLRTVKCEEEIEIQKRAGKVMAGLPELLYKNFKPGMTELELSVVIEDYFRINGHAGIVRCRREGIELSGLGVLSSGANMLAGTKFDGICAGTGITPAAPHGASYDPIRPGIPVIIDFSFNLEGYHIDQTRMFSWGKPSDEVLKAYDAMLQVEEAVLEMMKPGVTWEEPYNKAVELAAELGYEEEFMGLGAEKVRFVGHGLGLELDEPPYLAPGMTDLLAEGMVVAVEPKVSIPGTGVIGPEDTVVIRSNGVEIITTCPSEFIVETA